VVFITHEVLVEKLLKLSPSELKQVLDVLAERLAARHYLDLVREIIGRYRPVLEESVSR